MSSGGTSSSSGRRTKFEIFGDILDAIRRSTEREGVARKTRVHARVNVRYDRFQAYLEEMEMMALVRLAAGEEGHTELTITARGFELLNEYKRVRRFLIGFGLEKPRRADESDYSPTDGIG